MNQQEVEVRLKAALVKMHVYERPHNRISYAHTKEGLEKIYQDAPCDEKELKLRLKLSLGISMRYVEEYLAGFRAYGLIYRVDGMVYVDAPPQIPTPPPPLSDVVVPSLTQPASSCDYIKSGAEICGKSGEPITPILCEGCVRL